MPRIRRARADSQQFCQRILRLHSRARPRRTRRTAPWRHGRRHHPAGDAARHVCGSRSRMPHGAVACGMGRMVAHNRRGVHSPRSACLQCRAVPAVAPRLGRSGRGCFLRRGACVPVLLCAGRRMRHARGHGFGGRGADGGQRPYREQLPRLRRRLRRRQAYACRALRMPRGARAVSCQRHCRSGSDRRCVARNALRSPYSASGLSRPACGAMACARPPQRPGHQPPARPHRMRHAGLCGGFRRVCGLGLNKRKHSKIPSICFQE